MTETVETPETVTMDAAAPVGAVFSVDVEKRTIRGLAVPFGVEGLKAGKRFTFAKGTVKFGDPSRVKLWVGHDKAQAVGVATELTETDEGLEAAFKVARGAAGEQRRPRTVCGTASPLAPARARNTRSARASITPSISRYTKSA